ncbi:hypothetical protein N482_09200 [Pseudoalteromonas luteoviolacea NCIMB 1942]|uniref:Uncharacterized protein n=1 Tax=Pseudoalteromonas luteoviolacea NCIMB 1942 TaxID=1365253 RepID=A0A167CL62_9GAMM|nr:hypothetical protein N482_09200 [Pseudoalteromonas luteoviolacea NCIMB 1942]
MKRSISDWQRGFLFRASIKPEAFRAPGNRSDLPTDFLCFEFKFCDRHFECINTYGKSKRFLAATEKTPDGEVGWDVTFYVINEVFWNIGIFIQS